MTVTATPNKPGGRPLENKITEEITDCEVCDNLTYHVNGACLQCHPVSGQAHPGKSE